MTGIAAPPAPPSLGERWWTKIRNADVCRARVPLEAVLSYPIPGLIPGGRVLHAFHYRRRATAPDEDWVIRPVSRLTASLPALEVVEFRQAGGADGPPLFPGLPEQVRARPGRPDRQARRALLSVIPTLTERYSETLPGELGRQFLDALRALEAEALLPYYEALSPDFFRWCQQA